MTGLADYLELTAVQAREQFQDLLRRRSVSSGRQVTFLPAETLLCLAASYLVNHRHFGGGTASRAPEPVPSLAQLFPGCHQACLPKMANLDGSRSHGGPGGHELPASCCVMTRRGSAGSTERCCDPPAPKESDRAGLPDFLGLEEGGELALLGQEELDLSELEAELRAQVARQAG